MAKNTLKLLKLVEFLIDYSSSERMLSIKEIVSGISAKMEKRGVYDEVDENEYLDPTIKRQVYRLLNKYADKELINGIKIVSVKKNNKEILYYAKTGIDKTYLMIIRDAISVFPYIDEKVIIDILNTLNKFTDIYNRKEVNSVQGNYDRYPVTYIKNIKEINKALSTITFDENNGDSTKRLKKSVNKIKFRYCNYDIQKKLTGNELITVNPIAVIYVGGNSYLVAFDDNDECYKNYRVDRMLDVECTNETAKVCDDFNLKKYKRENVFMNVKNYEKTSVLLRCDGNFMNEIVDTFGINVVVTSPQTYYERKKINYGTGNENEVLIEIIRVNREGIIKWLLANGDSVELLEPASLRKELFNKTQSIMKMYRA